MDIRFESRELHIPPEILDAIVGFLDKSGLTACRLVSKALHGCANKRLIARPSQPSEIFQKGKLDVPRDILDRYKSKGSPEAIAIWTWVRFPVSSIDDTTLSQEFKNLLCAPQPRLAGQPNNATGGRLATCWGRMLEDPGLVAIVMRECETSTVIGKLLTTLTELHDEKALQNFRSSIEALQLRDYVQAQWPGSIQSSTRTRWHLRSPYRSQQHLTGWSYTEIRTVYFRADMTPEQRAIVNNTHTNQSRANIIPRRKDQPGPTTWAWLPGFHQREGQLAIAARFLLRWESPELRSRFRTGMEVEYEGERVTQLERFERELEAAGRIDQEVFHCNFESGPWRT